MNDVLRPLAALALPLALLACSAPAADPGEPPLAGAQIGGPFALTDQDGRPVTDRSYAGRYRIMYFGYTFCPDVCPVDVQKIAAGMKALAAEHPDKAAKVVPIFVSVDPERDTVPVVREFVRAFSPDMVGLTGSPEAVAEAAKAYGVYAQKGEPTEGGSYLVGHSRQAVLFGPDGKPLALVPTDRDADAVAAEIARWVA